MTVLRCKHEANAAGCVALAYGRRMSGRESAVPAGLVTVAAT